MRASEGIITSALILAAAVFPAPAGAQTKQQLNWCNGKDGAAPDLKIGGCTAAIQSGKFTGNDLAAAFLNRGNAYLNMKDYDRAIADYDQSLRLNPKYIKSFGNRGLAYANKKDYDRAIANYNEVIRLDPKLFIGFYNRANAYANKKDYDHAIADYNEVIRLNPTLAVAFGNRGIAYANKEDYGRAVADYSQAIKLDPSKTNFFINRGLAYAGKGDDAHAIPDYDQVLKRAPKDALALQGRAKSLAKTGDLTRAIQDQKLFIAVRKPTDSWPLIALATYYRDSKQYELSLAALKEAAKYDEDGPGKGPGMSVFYHTGWTLQLMGRDAEAIRAFTTGIPKQPDYYWARVKRALSYEKIGERDKALQDLKEAAAHIKEKNRDDELRKKLAEYGLK